MNKIYEIQVVIDEDMSERLYCVVAHYEGNTKNIVACYKDKHEATQSVKEELENDLKNK